jgi:hypothetical protein
MDSQTYTSTDERLDCIKTILELAGKEVGMAMLEMKTAPKNSHGISYSLPYCLRYCNMHCDNRNAAHYAARSGKQCILQFVVDHCRLGPDILLCRDSCGANVAHYVFSARPFDVMSEFRERQENHARQQRTLQYLSEISPIGSGIFTQRDKWGNFPSHHAAACFTKKEKLIYETEATMTATTTTRAAPAVTRRGESLPSLYSQMLEEIRSRFRFLETLSLDTYMTIFAVKEASTTTTDEDDEEINKRETPFSIAMRHENYNLAAYILYISRFSRVRPCTRGHWTIHNRLEHGVLLTDTIICETRNRVETRSRLH